MILVLGEENISSVIQKIRKKIQKDKGMHIGDNITLSQFIELYNEYGNGFEKRIFGRYVLDISYGVLKSLTTSEQKTTKVFTMEKLNEEEIENIRREIIQGNNLHIGDEINYSQLVQLYNSIETVLSLKVFASEILEINNKVLIQIKNKSNKKAKILSRTRLSNSEIIEIREKIKEENHLQENDRIGIRQFEDMYERYGGILGKKEFAKRVLEINRSSLYQLKNKRENATTKVISQNETLLDDNEIDLVRKQISQEYDLHIDDYIDLKTFKQIFGEYKGIYTEDQLAEEIFGVPLEYFYKSNPVKVFQKIKLSKDYIKCLRNDIIEKEKLHSEDTITYKELEMLHKKYGEILSINQFATIILDIPETNIANMKAMQATTILKNECLSLDDLEELTENVLKEYELHINDTIDHKQFREMYEKYGGIMSERQFSEDVLDVPYRLISDKLKHGDNRAIILSSTFISEEYNESLRNRILKETDLKINQRIDYQCFYKIYIKYGGILEERYFAEKILQMPETKYYIIKNNKDAQTTLFINMTINKSEFEQLKEKILEENNLHIRDFINYTEFLRIYNQYPTNLKEKDFANVILGMSEKDYNNIKYTNNARTRILKDEIITDEEIRQKREFFKHMEGKNINYSQFKEIHRQYGGIMDEFSFCEQVLGFKLNFIKYYKTNASIKDPIAKQKGIEIRKKFENELCRFFTREEINNLCKEYGISEKDFLNYVVLKYNFQFYKETEESLQINNGIWFGGKKIPLTRGFINKFSNRLMSLARGITKNLAKAYKLDYYIQEDITQELIIKAIEEYGELEMNFSYDIEETIKRIGVRMRSNGRNIMCSHFKLQSNNVSERYYYKDKAGPDIQLIDTETSVEEKAMDNITYEKSEFADKVVFAIRKLAQNGNNSNEIGQEICNYLRNRNRRFNWNIKGKV